MAFSDLFKDINIFGVRTPKYLEKLTTPEYGNLLSQTDIDQAKRDSLVSGLLTTGAAYLAQPKNLGAGSAAPYLGKAYMMGMESAKTPFNTLAGGVTNDIKFKELADANKAKETRSANIAQLEASDPKFKGLSLLPTSVQDKVLEEKYKQDYALQTPKAPTEAELKSEYVGLMSRNDLSEPEVMRRDALGRLFEKKGTTVDVKVDARDQSQKAFSGVTEKLINQIQEGDLRKNAETSKIQLGKYNKLADIVASGEFIGGGIGTDTKMYIARLADQFGAGGETLDERLGNTRQIIQTFAKAQLDAGALLKGMPSDKEQDLLQRAADGKFDEMSPAEISSAIETARYMNRQRIVQYNERVDQAISIAEKKVKRDPNDLNAQDLLDYLKNEKISLPIQIGKAKIIKG